MRSTVGDEESLAHLRTFTLEGLFPKSEPAVLDLARKYIALFHPRRRPSRWLDSPRIVKTADYGPRWRAHFVPVRTEVDLDDELRARLQESHDIVGMQSDLRR
jgi:hypothetical protein